MNKKKLGLTIFLSLLTIVFALILGNIDFYGFFDGRQGFNIMLILSSIGLTYLITISVFLFDFSDRKNVITVFSIVALLFTICFYFTSLNLIKTVCSGIFFFIFLDYIYYTSLKRSKLFISFQPNDIFLPAVKNGFLLLVILFAILSFVQTRSLLTEDRQLSPLLLRLISKPIVSIINKQLSTQISKQIDEIKSQQSVTLSKQELTKIVLVEMVKVMDPVKTKHFLFGITPDQIHIQNAIVKENGDIDLSPVVDELIPLMAENINNTYSNYVSFTPFIIAFIVIILLQSSIWPFAIVAGFITPFIFYLLFSFGILKKTKESAEVEKIVL